MSRATRIGVLLAIAGAGGCGPATARVTGEVTYNGEPVKAGYVIFNPADGKGTAATAKITDGKYTAENVPPGAKVVAVEASTEQAPSVPLSQMTPEQRKRYDPK